MDNKKSSKAFSISTAFSRLFVSSLTSGILDKLRIKALRLRLRVIGVFFSTFGIYTIIASLITHFFSSRATDSSAVYFGIILAASSIPLLISADNISAALTDSFVGKMICELFGINGESLKASECVGRSNMGFAAGVIAGTLTIAFTPFQITAFILFAAASAVILIKPGAGPVLSMLGLLLFDSQTHCMIIAVTVVSYVIKLLRAKRSIALKKSDVVPAVFMLTVAGGCIFSVYGIEVKSMLRFAALISVYFLAILLYRDCKRVTRLETVACVSAALVACVFVLGRLSDLILPYGDTIISFVNGLYAFKSGAAPAVLAAVLPLTVGLAMRHHNTMSRFTMWLCAAADVCALVFMGAVSYLVVAAGCVFVMLLFVGRRNVYLAMTLVLSAAVLLLYTSVGSALYTAAASRVISDVVPIPVETESRYLICGRGFGASLSGDGGFYGTLFTALGAVGALLLAVSLLCTVYRFACLVKMTLCSDLSSGELRRFGAIRSAADTRVGAAAPLFACISLLLCGLFYNLWSSTVAFMLIWILCGMCVSYCANAEGELTKAKEASLRAETPEAAVIDISCSRRKPF